MQPHAPHETTTGTCPGRRHPPRPDYALQVAVLRTLVLPTRPR